MARLIRLRWPGLGEGRTRRERSGCEFEAYQPDPVCGRQFTLRGDVAADLADAEAEIARFNARPSPHLDTEGPARLLLRAEAVASSRIEGLAAGPRRILRAEAAARMGVASLDAGAEEILGNIRAMQLALAKVGQSNSILPTSLLDAHRELFGEAHGPERSGEFRTEQNWIGGNGYNPCGAVYVPPPPELLDPLIADLCAFSSGTDLSPLAQAGIAHAQFETIHPFGDGNGRIGRALIHMILHKRGLAPHFVPPISLALAGSSKAYIGGLTAFRHIGPRDSAAANEAANQWLGTFAAAARAATRDADRYERALVAVAAGWRTELGSVRGNSAVDLLLAMLVAAPILTVRTAQQSIGRSFEATNRAVTRLVVAGILQPITVGRRNRAFEATDVINAIIALERDTSRPASQP